MITSRPDRTRLSSLSLISVILVVSGLLVLSPATVRSQSLDISYRTELPFNDVKVTRQVSSALNNKNYSKLQKALNLLEPVIKHHNEAYPIEGEPRTLLEDINAAISSGDDEKIRTEVLEFLLLDLKDMIRITHEYSKSDNRAQAKVFVKKSLLIFQACKQNFIQNVSEKTDHLKAADVGIQKMNRDLGSPDKIASHREKIEGALKKLFPTVTL